MRISSQDDTHRKKIMKNAILFESIKTNITFENINRISFGAFGLLNNYAILQIKNRNYSFFIDQIKIKNILFRRKKLKNKFLI